MWRETVGAAAVDVAVDGGGGAGGFGRWLDGFALAGARVVMVCASSNSPSKTGRSARSGVAGVQQQELACPVRLLLLPSRGLPIRAAHAHAGKS